MSITLRSVWHDYRESRTLKPNTENNYEQVLNNTMSDWLSVEIQAINKDMVEEKFKEISRETPTLANYTFRIVRALMNFASYKYEDDEGYPLIKNNPTKRLSELRLWNKTKPRKGHIPTHKMADYFTAVLMMQNVIIRDYLLVLTLTGLRSSEALTLKWSDVDLKYGYLTVRDTKNGEDHTLPLSNWLWAILNGREQVEEFVFPGRGSTGRLIHPYECIRKVSRSAGVKFTPHDLRRTFLHVARLAGVDPVTRKQLVNHSFQDVTGKHYTVIDMDEMRSAMQMITDKYMVLANLS